MNKQQIISGVDSIGSLKQLFGELKAKRVLLFTGNKSFFTASYRQKLMDLLSGMEVIHFHEIAPNPQIEQLELGISFAQKNEYDIALAVGGGSVIDSAKIINFFAAQSCSIRSFFEQNKAEIIQEPNKLIAIATTSGTGSESTQFATLYIEKKKYSLDRLENLPTHVVIDPLFSIDLPQYVTAYTAIDALAQAIESYWSIYSNDQSKALAGQAIKLINSNIDKVMNQPDSKEYRLQMALGANLAGQAIQITKTTAPHAISYPMTSFFNIPHGQAVGLSLPSILLFNYGVDEDSLSDSRGVAYVKQTIVEIAQLLGASSVEDAGHYLLNLLQNVGLETQLRAFGMSSSDLSTIVDNGFNPARVKNNPRLLTRQQLFEILERIY